MSAAQHTPGPWHVHQPYSNSLPHIRNADGVYVMDAPQRADGYHAKVRQMADARLISAAPELLEIVQQLIACHDEPMCPALDVARAVVAKATGSAS